jgi:uncharacterized protein with HEPN domain
MPPRVVKLLEDVESSAASIQRYISGMTEEDYLANQVVRRAVEREFEIVGEALRRLSSEFPNVFSRVTDARRIVDFRNVLAHGYDLVDDGVVWNAIQSRLPTLLQETIALIRETETEAR